MRYLRYFLASPFGLYVWSPNLCVYLYCVCKHFLRGVMLPYVKYYDAIGKHQVLNIL